MPRLVVVGGGISGAAAAFTAKEIAPHLEVVLLERENEVGGKALSLTDDGWLFETGPLGYLNNEPVVDELVKKAGLEGELLRAGKAQTRRFVFASGKMRQVGVASGILSFRGLLRAAKEPFVPRKAGESDESVWDFAARRLGSEFAERFIHPMVLGIFAGDAKKLSLPAAFPVMAELEREHGSLVKAQIARRHKPRAVLSSFRGGMQELPRALAARGGFRVLTNTSVKAVLREKDGWRVAIEGESLSADSVILACEGWQAAALLDDSVAEIAAALREIPYPPVYVVALGYGSQARAAVPEGFGVLIPRGAGYRALGVTWDSYLFSSRSRGADLLVRVLFGGSFDPEIDALGAEEVIELAVLEMERLFRLQTKPLFTASRLWPRAIPQYELGHLQRLRGIEERLASLPGLYLAGNALYGPSFGKAAARGVACGREAARSL